MATTVAAEVLSTVATILTTSVTIAVKDFQASVLWILIVGFIIAFVLAFAVGANDVANSFGTTVGSGTLTLKQACILGSIFETLGAILLGAKVGQTIRKGIVEVGIYTGDESLLMIGEVSAMLASGLWQLIATFLKLPVSGTHSIVGATIGFSLVAKGAVGVNWKKMGLIVGSWFLSPVLAGLMAAGFYFMLRILIFQKDEPVRPGLIALPIMYGFTIAINCFSVFFSGAPLLGFNQLSPLADVAISAAIGLVVALLIQFIVVRRLRKSFQAIEEERQTQASQMVTEVNGQPGFGRKISKLPTVMETISEKDSPDVSNMKLEENGSGDNLGGNNHLGSISETTQLASTTDKSPPAYDGIKQGDHNSPKRVRIESLKNEMLSPRTVEDAKRLREKNSKRSKSLGGDARTNSSSVRIPPLLQLEKNVMKANIPLPSAQEIKEEIRRNFSEPAMQHLVSHGDDGGVYEVFINRNRKVVTIHRKSTSNSESHDPIHHMGDQKHESDLELTNLLSAIPPDLKLEDPFEESEDEGLAMSVPASEPLVQNIYSGAIEKGFRKLSNSQQNVIAIKIEEKVKEPVEAKKLTKDEIMEAKEGRIEVRKMFSFLQVLTACFGSFAHGGNDVSNAIGPLIALWIIFQEGAVQQQADTPLWILLYGGIGICCGLWVWGRRVIETMGNDLTNLTPSRGFAIELMSAITVLMASNVGLPVSTTHCKVGAVVAVGWVRAREAVDWKIFRNIVLAWFVTVPISGGLSAVTFAIIRAAANL
ncbi:unnamed protein product [Clavelina lepadiformis]|uniref:Phosphate transporter n=1 Tax=Clavelina lepadiformis TaxID=159417 RepID=A0ABP0GAT7_CLALP